MIDIIVKFLGYEFLTGTNEIRLTLPVGATVKELAPVLTENFPKLRSIVDRTEFLVNKKSCTLATELNDRDEVYMLKLGCCH